MTSGTDLRATLARERLARALVARGLASAKADEIAGGVECSQAGEETLLEAAGTLALAGDPASLDALAARLMPPRSAAEVSEAVEAEARAAGKAAADAERKRRDENKLAFK